MKVFIIIAAILIAAIVVYAAIENICKFSTRHEGKGGKLKVLQISDIHKRSSRRMVEKLLDIAREEKPDLIFLTGDLISRTQIEFDGVERLFMKLCDIAPVYMCVGNHEQSLPGMMKGVFFDMLNDTDVKLLINSGEFIEVGGRDLYVCGIMPQYTTYKKDGGYSHLDPYTLEEMTEKMGEAPSCEVLLLAHNPMFAKVYANWGADHTFCGHVHGGIVRIGGKGLFSPERKLFPRYCKGVYNIKRRRNSEKPGAMKLFVTSGIGKLRLFNPPEVVVYELD